MYAIERIRIIKHYLKEKGQAQVHTLSNLLGVSEVTVRRDLVRLEKEGWLTRTHGGAVINENNETSPLAELLEEPADDGSLDEIASVALKMIHDGDVVMLTNGSVNNRLAVKLEERSNLIVLTNDLSIALHISLQDSNKVVLLGGDMNKEEKALFGSMTMANLRKFYVNRLFVEVDGINEHLQLTVNNQEKADLILSALELSEQTIVVCPSNRFSSNAFYRLGSINIAEGIISNTDLDDSYKTRIFNSDIPLFTTASPFEGSE